MLQNKPNSDTQEVPAAQVRVKTEELAKAIAAIEARKQEQARLLEGTVAVGDAVKELQLEETPEEILDEVARQREAAASEATSHDWDWRDRPVYNNTTWKNIGLGAVIAVPVLLIGWMALLSQGPNANNARLQAYRTSSPVGAANVFVPPTSMQFMMPVPVSTLANGKSFKLYWGDLSSIFNGMDQSDLRIRPLYGATAYPLQEGYLSWHAVKYNGQIYLRGWITQRIIVSPTPIKTLTIFNTDRALPPGARPIQITTPLQELHYLSFSERMFNTELHSSPSQDMEIVTTHIKLDKHAWEKW